MKKNYFFLFIIPFITSCQTLFSQQFKNSHQHSLITIDKPYLKSQANWFYIKAEQESQQGLHSRSIASFKEALVYHPQSFVIHLSLLNEYLKSGQNLQAFKQNQFLLKKYPQNIDLHLQLGKIYEKNKLYYKALEEYNWVLKRNPNHIETLYQTALLHFRNKEYVLARPHLKTLSQIGEKHLHQIHYFLALINKHENHIQKSIFHLKKSVYFKPQFFPSTLELFHYYQKTSQIDKAIYTLEEFKKSRGVSSMVPLMLFQLYHQKQDWTKAIQYLLSVLDNDPNNLFMRVQLAKLWAQQKEYTKAGLIMKDIISKHPQLSVKPYLLYTSFLEKKKDFSGALEVLHQASQAFSQDTEVLFYRAFMYDQIGNKKQAIQSLKMVLDINANHIEALNYLAFMYVETNKDLKTAEKMVMRALSFFPKNSYILDTAGWVFFKQGKTKLALKYLQQAYQNNNSEGLIAAHLAEVYYHMDILDKSIVLYQKAIKLETNEYKKQQLQKKLATIKVDIS